MRKTTANLFAVMPSAFDNAAAATAKRVEPALTAVATGIDLPVRTTKRGSTSLYPFADLEIGACFGVKNKTAKQLASIVSNANKKAMVQETDANGPVFNTKEITGADGTKSVVADRASPKMVATRHYFAFDVDKDYKAKIKGTALEGSTVLVFRDK